MPRPRIISEPSRITVTFDKRDYESVCAIAATEHDSNSGVVRRAVREWLNDLQSKARPVSRGVAVRKRR